MSARLEQVFAYHDATKHHYHAYAPGPGILDWATQPDPFRRYAGCETVPLEQFPHPDGPLYTHALIEGRVEPAALTRETVSRLLYDSLALSAWKQAGQSRWALRVNPSSGNLHPTEASLISGPVSDFLYTPVVCHYAPRLHALEVRSRFDLNVWRDLVADLPSQVLIIGLSSIYWREAWKYGSRAFRYCQHDTGHAIAAIAFAAAALGWRVSLLDDLSDAAKAVLLGLSRQHGPEAEYTECLLAVYPPSHAGPVRTLPDTAIQAMVQNEWSGIPNILSPGHRSWPIIDEVDAATRKAGGDAPYPVATPAEWNEPAFADTPLRLRDLVHRRRSAVAMDGTTGISRAAFYSMLQRCMPDARRFPFNALPWSTMVHLLLFVHRVQDVSPGLYLLIRDPAKKNEMQEAFAREFDWTVVEGCPETLPFYQLEAGDCRQLAARVSCHQEIAADGVFAVAMLAEFEQPLRAYGPWFYRRLYWECGAIGQLLYLEAEAHGIQATGIGCYFDDPVHEVLGLRDRRYQSLYHFTLGGGVADIRLTTLPPYAENSQLLPDRT